MNRIRRDQIILFCLALVVRLGAAALIPHPGYMDAAYYAAGAINLGQGNGFSEPFIWNYLSESASLPHPGFLYWMLLPSLLAAPFAALFPGSFFALQLPFAILSALLPCLAYAIAWRTAAPSAAESSAKRRRAWTAGLLMLFSGFFFPYWTLPETFAPFALLGSLTLWLSATGGSKPETLNLNPLLIGALAGLAHLTRADGVILLPIVALAPLASLQPRKTLNTKRFIIYHLSFVILGYLLVMAPWFIRNLSVIGAPLSPAGAKTLWLTNYDDLFCYRCDLSLHNYLAWDWGSILRSKLFALWVNFQRFLVEDCLIFLFPFILVGLYRLRRRLPFTLALIYLFLIYLAHSLAFTFPGPRGGFFHASAAALPFLLIAAIEGLDAALGWAARWRRWNLRQAQMVFTTAAVIAAMALSAYAAAEKNPRWRGPGATYREIDHWLDESKISEDTIIMVGDPPSFWYHSGRYAVVVPNEDVATLREVVERHRVEYILLDRDHPVPLTALYNGEEEVAWLRAVASWGDEVLYAVRLDSRSR